MPFTFRKYSSTCLATYPFFRDVAETLGRLLNLQGSVALSQVTRRVAESWGERSTVIRATQRVVRSMVEWGMLEESGERGMFSAARPSAVPDGDAVGAWLAVWTYESGWGFFVEIERVVGVSLMRRDFIPTEGMAMPQEGGEPR